MYASLKNKEILCPVVNKCIYCFETVHLPLARETWKEGERKRDTAYSDVATLKKR